MRSFTTACAAGLTAMVLASSAPALAQGYGYDEYDGPVPYGYGAPRYEPYGGGYAPAYGGYAQGYGGYAPVYGGYAPAYGGYNPHHETFIGPYGYAHRRCRPHKACYNGID